MRYIRTKNGIYEVVEDNNKEWGKQIVVKFPKNLNMKLVDVKDQILKQADTIEELCDEFVVAFEENNDKITYLDLDWAIDKAKRYAGHTTIYGAIWTDKGLQFVARMNEKGDYLNTFDEEDLDQEIEVEEYE